MSAAVKVIRELVAQFPDAPAQTLAKRAYRENPELWSTLDACKQAVRSVLGVKGKQHRTKVADKSLFREQRKSGWTGIIPEAISQLDDWRAVQITGAYRTLILSDIHIPYHDSQALELALDYGIKHKPTLIILNGDIFDFYSISRWEKDPRRRDFTGEVRDGRQFLKGMRKRFPKARIIFKEGNHEERWYSYLRLKAPELLGLPDFDWQSVYGLTESKIELVDKKRPIRLGELNVIHGHEYVFSISNPVNPARGMYLRAKTHILGGHFHQPSQHSERSLEQKVISAWSTGCICDLHPEYRPLNPWGHGFAYVETDRAGAFTVQNLRIVNGKVY